MEEVPYKNMLAMEEVQKTKILVWILVGYGFWYTVRKGFRLPTDYY